MTFLESAFEIQKITPVRDPLFTYYIMSLLNPDASCLQGEIGDVLLRLNASNKGYTLAQFEKDVNQNWHTYGITLPLVVAAKFMPTMSHWLPLGHHGRVEEFEGILKKVNECDAWEKLHGCLSELIGMRHHGISSLC
jgi:hypothetical protein